MKQRIEATTIVVLAAALFLIVTASQGLGVTTDGVSYLEIATNLKAGKGVVLDRADGSTTLVTHWPPLYPIVLCVVSRAAGVDILGAALIVSVTGLAAALLCFYALLLRHGVQPPWIIVSVLILFFSPAFRVFYFTSSESLFIPLVLLGAVFLAGWAQSQSRVTLALATALFGIATLVRYAGLGFFAAVPPFILLVQRPWRRRRQSLVLSCAIFSTIVGIWLSFALSASSRFSPRSFNRHILGFEDLRVLVSTFRVWVSPQSRIAAIGIVVVLGLLLIGLARLRPADLVSSAKELRTPIALGFSYLAFLGVSISFFDAHTQFDTRILAPILPLVLLGLTTVMSSLAAERRIRTYAVLLGLVVMTAHALDFVQYSRASQCHGPPGYTSQRWQNSEVVGYYRSKLSDLEVFTNGRAALAFFGQTRLGINELPKVFNPVTRERNDFLEAELSAIGLAIQRGDAAIVYFTELPHHFFPPEDKVVKYFRNCCIHRLSDGVIIHGLDVCCPNDEVVR